MSTIDELIARLEAATGPDRELDEAIAIPIGTDTRTGPIHPSVSPRGYSTCPHYTCSIDAALTLVGDGPGRFWRYNGMSGIASVTIFTDGDRDTIETQGKSARPALALCIAALKARARNP